MKYAVNDVYPCIQGEGAMTGMPMALVRLHGCTVGCAFCDTKETWMSHHMNQHETILEILGTNARWAEVEPSAIIEAIQSLAPGLRWVLLTGGEPAEQDLGPLVAALHEKGYLVAVETSGTAPGVIGAKADWVCVSPKVSRKAIIPEVMAIADEVKMVVGVDVDIAKLRELLTKFPPRAGCRVSLQPMSASPAATALCMKTCMATGWSLSLQTHKWINAR